MRGRLILPHSARPYSGNTPAYAGKTIFISEAPFHGWKHPRVCGEDAVSVDAAMLAAETPPRMRGRLLVLVIIFR